MNIGIISTIGLMALLDTLSPAVLGVTIFILLRNKKGESRLLSVYLLTVAVFYFIIGFVIMLGLDFFDFSVFGGITDNKFIKWVMIIVGGSLFIGSFFVPKNQERELKFPKYLKTSTMIILGITTSIVEVATALPYFASLALLKSLNVDFLYWFLILIGYNFIMIAPSLLLLLLKTVFRGRINPLLERIRRIFAKSSSSTLSWVMFFVGLILLYNGSN